MAGEGEAWLRAQKGGGEGGGEGFPAANQGRAGCQKRAMCTAALWRAARFRMARRTLGEDRTQGCWTRIAGAGGAGSMPGIPGQVGRASEGFERLEKQSSLITLPPRLPRPQRQSRRP